MPWAESVKHHAALKVMTGNGWVFSCDAGTNGVCFREGWGSLMLTAYYI